MTTHGADSEVGRLETVRNRLQWWPSRQLYLDARLLDADSMLAFHRDLVRTRTALIEGYVGAVLEFAAFVERTLADPCISSLLTFEDVQRNAEIKSRRQALLDAGAPLTAETWGVREARRGMMRL